MPHAVEVLHPGLAVVIAVVAPRVPPTWSVALAPLAMLLPLTISWKPSLVTDAQTSSSPPDFDVAGCAA